VHSSLQRVCSAFAASLIAGFVSCQQFEYLHEGVLGTSLALRVDAQDAAAAASAEQRVLAEVARLDLILSGHREDSEFARFVKARESASVSKELLAVLDACDRWGAATDGAFDAAFSRASASVTLASASYSPPWQLDVKRGAAKLVTSSAVGLDGLAKGYVIDRACAAAMAGEGVRGALVDIGGDLCAVGSVEQLVSVANPLQPADNAAPLFTLTLRDRAIATSGSYARPMVSDDGAHVESHIRDPKTGAGVTEVLGATVWAPACVDADALATALHVMEIKAGLALVERLENFECVIVDASGKVHQTSGVAALALQGDAAVPAVAIAGAGLEVSLSFEIRKQAGKSKRSYRRPYVAVWIEDQDGNDVRTLCLWIERRRWLRDLRKWYRIHRRDNDLIEARTRATRRPGSYELIWDGMSNDGEEVPAGEYVLCLEVAREHGTHQMMRAPFKTRLDQTVTMETNEEIAAAVVTVRREGGGSK